MRKLIPPILLSLLVLASAARHVYAQEEKEQPPPFKMPCAQVVKLGLDKFTEVYGEKTQDYSTYGMKQALGYYVDCRRPANDAEAQRLPEGRRRQVYAVREHLAKLGNAAWDMAYIEAGGGTMYGLLSVSAYAAREDFMTTLIKALAQAEQQQRSRPVARRRANQSMARARRLLARWSRVPKMKDYSWDSPEEMRRQYLNSVGAAREAVAQLQLLVGELPDAAAERVAKRMADELDAGIEE